MIKRTTVLSLKLTTVSLLGQICLTCLLAFVLSSCKSAGSFADSETTFREWLQKHPIYNVVKKAAEAPMTDDTLQLFVNLETQGLVWTKPWGTTVQFFEVPKIVQSTESHGQPKIIEAPQLLSITMEHEGYDYYQFNFPVDLQIMTAFHMSKICTGDNWERLYAIDWLRWNGSTDVLKNDSAYLVSNVLPRLSGEGESVRGPFSVRNGEVRHSLALLAVEKKLPGFDSVVTDLSDKVKGFLLQAETDAKGYDKLTELLNKLERYGNENGDASK